MRLLTVDSLVLPSFARCNRIAQCSVKGLRVAEQNSRFVDTTSTLKRAVMQLSARSWTKLTLVVGVVDLDIFYQRIGVNGTL